ncbi:hypothetical protein BV898_19719 [Hypsibius exemplaris]|uniref:Uncharacterized protein n=1 Tax=Hypsibius exemplaris TaxID=2072580 RepID=A0A9X6NJH0_HYPEX|nr:hypothetical protein BV898_19719 [Hypsibius exemplaris]
MPKARGGRPKRPGKKQPMSKRPAMLHAMVETNQRTGPITFVVNARKRDKSTTLIARSGNIKQSKKFKRGQPHPRDQKGSGRERPRIPQPADRTFPTSLNLIVCKYLNIKNGTDYECRGEQYDGRIQAIPNSWALAPAAIPLGNVSRPAIQRQRQNRMAGDLPYGRSKRAMINKAPCTAHQLQAWKKKCHPPNAPGKIIPPPNTPSRLPPR